MTEPSQPVPTLVLIVGGDALALRVCDELMEFEAQTVTVLWPHADDVFEARLGRCGATLVRGRPDDEESLVRAGACDAFTIMLLTDDDHLNLEASLKARDLNPKIRIVMRQFNRTLGAKIEAKLPNCSVISLAAQSAATYATVAVDRSCFYGVQFPDFTGPLFGFAERSVARSGLVGLRPDEAEAHLGQRILAMDAEIEFDRAAVLRGGSTLVTFGPVRAAAGAAKHSGLSFAQPGLSPAAGVRRVVRALWRTDPLAARLAIAAVTVFVAASAFFSARFQIDPLTATYFVMTTMTTTGYGDIIPHPDDHPAQLATMATMVSGTIFTAIFFAVLTSRFTQAQWRLQQGLRRISRRGHVVVCGAGNVGTRVIDFLHQLGRQVIVIEAKPRSTIVDRSRDREFDLLTGDATADSTLGLCNLSEADVLIALTESDTMNLEVALGAGQINARLPVIMRVQEETFARSVAEHFGIVQTFGTAGLAAPVFAGLAIVPGMRGVVTIAGREFGVLEQTPDAPREDGVIPLAVWRDGAAVLVGSLADVRPDDRVLLLYPAYRFRKRRSAASARRVASHAGIHIDYAARTARAAAAREDEAERV